VSWRDLVIADLVEGAATILVLVLVIGLVLLIQRRGGRSRP
jgi:hypothetical protein